MFRSSIIVFTFWYNDVFQEIDRALNGCRMTIGAGYSAIAEEELPLMNPGASAFPVACYGVSER